MITFQVRTAALKQLIDRALIEMPHIALDSMAHAMHGLRKDFIPDLRARMPAMATTRAQYGFFRVQTWKSRGGSVVGKFLPKTTSIEPKMRWLERGGTVRAKGHEFMAIPTRHIRKQGSDRAIKERFKGGPRAWAMGAARRHVKMVFVSRDKGYIFQSPHKRGSTRVKVGGKTYQTRGVSTGETVGPPLWTLVRSVTIGPRLGLQKYWAKATTRDRFRERIRSTLVKGFKGTWKPAPERVRRRK